MQYATLDSRPCRRPDSQFCRLAALVIFVVALVAGCASETPKKPLKSKAPVITAPRIQKLTQPLQCVPYARRNSGVKIRGNAHTWWRQAARNYDRGVQPRVGAILVLRKTRRLRYGHLAVVRRIISSREIIVDHANWLNRGRVHLGTPVRDVSRKNDWSAVRVWYIPGQQLGRRRYAAHGFIYGHTKVSLVVNFRNK
jgi:surface antigen